MTDKVSKIVEKMGIVQAKQAQNKVEQASNKDNSDKLGEELHRLKAELEAAKKPELRHGDYGLVKDRGNMIRFVCRDNKSRTIDQGGRNTFHCGDNYLQPEDVLGNFIDDLKAIAEPLSEFETNCLSSIDDRVSLSAINDPTRGEVFELIFYQKGERKGNCFVKASDFTTKTRRLQHTLRSKK